MSGKNDITGDSLISKPTTEEYSEGWEKIFGKKTHWLEEVLEGINQQTSDHDKVWCTQKENKE